MEKSDISKITELLESAGYDIHAIENEMKTVWSHEEGNNKIIPNGFINIKVSRRPNDQ